MRTSMRRPPLSSRRGGRDDGTLLVVRAMLPSALSVSLLYLVVARCIMRSVFSVT
jgi:hypothetical protein